ATWLSVLAGGGLLLAWPDGAPLAVLPGLVLSLRPMARAWCGARGTALGASVCWGIMAIVLGMVAEALAATEPPEGGRAAAGLGGPGRGRAPEGPGRLRLDSPWTIFYGLLVLAGVTNYLPTRFGLAAAWLGLGFLVEYVGLTRAGGSAEARAAIWAAVPWTLA